MSSCRLGREVTVLIPESHLYAKLFACMSAAATYVLFNMFVDIIYL